MTRHATPTYLSKTIKLLKRPSHRQFKETMKVMSAMSDFISGWHVINHRIVTAL